MTRVEYVVVEHDGGWAYKLGDVFSETFKSHDLALRAARRAAREQRVPGDDVGITYEDARGVWRSEFADGHDRPETDVIDD
jgi:hypothetical protein